MTGSSAVDLWLIASAAVCALLVFVLFRLGVLERVAATGVIVVATVQALYCIAAAVDSHGRLPIMASVGICACTAGLWAGVLKFRHDASVRGYIFLGLIGLVLALVVKAG